MAQIAALGTALVPLGAVALLLWLASRRDRIREAVIARQIRLTDAVAAELGAVVAPVVTRPFGRAWQVHIAVPLSRPTIVARILALTHAALERMGGRYEIILTAQEPEPLQAGLTGRGPSPASVARLRAA